MISFIFKIIFWAFCQYEDAMMSQKEVKQSLEKEYWENEIKKDDWGWIINEDDWIDYFNNKTTHYDFLKADYYDIKFINHEDKGFVFLKEYTKSNKIYIHFAFVALEYRKQGILKTMINDIKNKYETYTISLESADNLTDKVWERLEFRCMERKKKRTLNKYIYKEKND